MEVEPRDVYAEPRRQFAALPHFETEPAIRDVKDRRGPALDGHAEPTHDPLALPPPWPSRVGSDFATVSRKPAGSIGLRTKAAP